ncbi:protein toll-like [Leptopilina boulardi]|uniref:protein toll-like n=1 Tax=Leptopilina boulardi TaxID=63433 RepID=UPI0021F5E37C|nr:protein toll-like [Leptopilina boulardi]
MIISNNELVELESDVFINLTSLKCLILTNNKLTTLPQNIFEKNVHTTELGQNHDFILDVSHNNITRIHFNSCATCFSTDTINNITLLLNDNPIECDDILNDLLKYLDGSMRKDPEDKLFIEIDPMKCSISREFDGILSSNINSTDYESSPSKEEIINYEMCPKACDIRKRHSNRKFIIDCSYRNLTQFPETFCYSSEENYNHELNLTGNFIKDMPNFFPIGFENIILKLNNNQLTTLSMEIKQMIYLSVDKIELSNNPWHCNCHLFELVKQQHVEDIDNLNCNNSNIKIKMLSYNELCPMEKNVFITLVGICVGIIGLSLGAFIIFYQRSQNKIKIWLYTHNICLCFITEEKLDKDKIYDAFISYSHKDEEFVVNELIMNLEREPQSFKLCIHFRDWLAGEWIPTQIVKSIKESRRTIVVVSSNFIESEWGKMELRAAYQEAYNDGIARIIVVLYGDIGPIDNLEPDLKSYLKMNTYVQWGDPWFWDKLRYALPHKSNFESKKLDTKNYRPHPVAQLDFNKIEKTSYSNMITLPLDDHEKNSLNKNNNERITEEA